MTTDSVALLPAKWREAAERLKGVQRPYVTELARAEQYHSCADQLDAALATQPQHTNADMARAAEWLQSQPCTEHTDAILEARAAYQAPQVRTVKRDGELLALADRVDSLLGAEMQDAEAINEIAERLRTLATERRGVDEAMVERACVGMNTGIEADGEWPEDYPDDEQVIIRTGMRAALTAALQPSGEKA